MKLKRKSFIIINLTLLISFILFFILLENFGKRYYFYQKNLELNKIENSVKNKNNFDSNSEILIGEIPILKDNFEFNNQLKLSLFKKDSWKYNFWFGSDALKILNETGTITRNFEQKNLKSSFLIRVFKKQDHFVVLCLPLSSIEENLKLMKSFSLYIFFIISIFIWSVYTYYFRKITKYISNIELSLDKISKKDFSKLELIDSNDEFGNISKKLVNVSDKLKEYFELLNNKYESQKYFYNSLAHELKTPITVISGYTYYIKDILQEEDQKYCDFIITECKGMSQLAKKFQFLADNFKNLEFSTFSLDELVKTILEKFQLDFSDKNIDIKFLSKPTEIVGDYNLIKVVIDNLISNSLKFTKDVIDIEIYSDDDTITFSIYNNGENIPLDKITKIWEPFFFIEKNPKVDNWGFGLAIVADIVKRHNGSYKVENKENGVKFKIILPKTLK